MTVDQISAFAILAGVLVFFIGGWLRYDFVAFGALFAAVVSGIVPAESAYSGFGNPAVVTVALVLMISEGLRQSGVVDLLAEHVVPDTKSPTALIAVLAGLAAALSGLMNNVGGARIADAGGAPSRTPIQPLPMYAFNATVFRFDPGRHDNAHRHTTEHSCVQLSRRWCR